MVIFRGTTPTVGYRLPFPASELAEASIALAQNQTVIVEKNLSECDRVDDRISVVLTQEETLKLDAKKPVEVQLRVRLLTGTALATDPESVPAGRILRDGVI